MIDINSLYLLLKDKRNLSKDYILNELKNYLTTIETFLNENTPNYSKAKISIFTEFFEDVNKMGYIVQPYFKSIDVQICLPVSDIYKIIYKKISSIYITNRNMARSYFLDSSKTAYNTHVFRYISCRTMRIIGHKYDIENTTNPVFKEFSIKLNEKNIPDSSKIDGKLGRRTMLISDLTSNSGTNRYHMGYFTSKESMDDNNLCRLFSNYNQIIDIESSEYDKVYKKCYKFNLHLEKELDELPIVYLNEYTVSKQH